jgi:hypothetical protein
MASQFPIWTRTLGDMLNGGCKVRVICEECHEWKQVDIDALAARVGLEYSLIDRRSRCRLTLGCGGWNKFYFLQAVYRPLWSDARAASWLTPPPPPR